MNKVEVFHRAYEDILNSYYPSRVKMKIKTWLDDTEEGKFITQHSKKPVEVLTLDNPYTSVVTIRIYAYLDEEIEIFWRLKYK